MTDGRNLVLAKSPALMAVLNIYRSNYKLRDRNTVLHNVNRSMKTDILLLQQTEHHTP